MDPKYNTFEDSGTGKPDGTGSKKPGEDDDATFTVEDAVEHIGFGRFQIKLSCVAGFAWIADSMEIMVLSILGPTLLCEWQLSLGQEALITTVVFVGFLIGSPILGWMADKYGRKTSLVFAAAWATYYGTLSAAAPIYSWLLILRTICGVGIAGVPQAVTYYSEFLPMKYRGKCIIFLEMFWALGAVTEVVLAILILEHAGWRWWLASSALPLIFFVPLVLSLPESPRYLIAAGHLERAQASLEEVARTNKVDLPKGRLKPEPQRKRASFTELLSAEHRWTSLLLWFIWFVSAFSYYGIVLMSTEFIKVGTTCVTDTSGGLGEVEMVCPAECTALTAEDFIELLWTSVAEIPGLIITFLYIDFIGRKPAMTINFLVYSLSVFLLLICMPQKMLVVMLFIARAIISSAFQIVYVYTPEVYPTKMRATAIGVCNIFARSGAIITPFIAQVLMNYSLLAGLCVYGTLGILAAVAAILLPRETKGQHMAEG